MGSSKSPCTTSCRSSIDMALIFEKIVFLYFGDRQTCEQMHKPVAWSRSRCRERRLNNDWYVLMGGQLKFSTAEIFTVTAVSFWDRIWYGSLHGITLGGQPTQSTHRCTKHTSPPINLPVYELHCLLHVGLFGTVCKAIYLLMATLKPQSNGPLYSNTVIGTLADDGWAVTFGTARRSLLAVPNVTAHPSTANVPTSYYSMWHCNYLWTLKG